MEDKIKNHVGISEDIDNDLVGLPTLLWHYGSLEAEAYQLALTAKADMEQAHARTYKVLKEMSRKDKATEALAESQRPKEAAEEISTGDEPVEPSAVTEKED